jgi:hypothetical protein
VLVPPAHPLGRKDRFKDAEARANTPGRHTRLVYILGVITCASTFNVCKQDLGLLVQVATRKTLETDVGTHDPRFPV